MTKRTPDHPAIEVFFAYSREDKQLRNKLAKHLISLKRKGIISTWYDGDIIAGSEWSTEIKAHLNSAQIILLLISADFMASDYCYFEEMNQAIQRHQAQEAVVIPVILRPTYWQIPELEKLQALPQDGKPVTTWLNQDEAFLNIVQEISKVAQRLNKKLIAEVKNRENLINKTKDESIEVSASKDREDLINKTKDESIEYSIQKDVYSFSFLDKISEISQIFKNILIADYSNYLTKSLTYVSHKEFQFPVINFNSQGKEINFATKTATYFTENLGNGISLDMVYIPGGTFMMGTEDEEIERFVQKYSWYGFRREQPIHKVTVKPFYIGKFQVTQVQWRQVAYRKKINRELKLNPSHFQGNNLPVESVSWYDAVEFCRRLSQKTGREYKLPSEAQWEYACRARTNTPFYFGETITEKLVNYDARKIFAQEPKGAYRGKTTPIGTFPPNNFGLYDMHGNVWEWCADPWHENYQGVPDDGRVWESGGNISVNVLRGGSWNLSPNSCRSAFRGNFSIARRDAFAIDVGFRVVCVPPLT